MSSPFPILTEDDLNNFVTQRVTEGTQLDFKKEVLTNDKLHKQVTGFANAEGGRLIFGVDEQNGVATAVCGITLRSGESHETVINRIHDTVKSNTRPPIAAPGIHSYPIQLKNGGLIVVTEVYKSDRAPHLVLNPNESFFAYARDGVATKPMDESQIRDAYTRTKSHDEGFETWRKERIANILANKGEIPLPSGVLLCMHVAPLTAFSSSPQRVTTANIDTLHKNRNVFNPVAASYQELCRTRSDHVLVWPGTPLPKGGTHRYTKICTLGRIETVAEFDHYDYGAKIVPVMFLETKVAESLTSYVNGLRSLGFLFPMIASVSLLNVRNSQLFLSRAQAFTHDDWVAHEEHLSSLPFVKLQTVPTEMSVALAPTFEAIWSAFGARRP
jgi:hypothetical protein